MRYSSSIRRQGWPLFSDLELAEAADFYSSVGALGRTFIEIETEAYRRLV